MKRIIIILFLILLLLFSAGCRVLSPFIPSEASLPSAEDSLSISFNDIPDYCGEPYVVIRDGIPLFTAEELTTEPFLSFQPLDSLQRCGTAYACLCRELMPTQERGPIGMIKPAGWHTVRYDFIDGGYLYNRCHLIGYQFCGENANELNLITGTRSLNIEGMLPFENEVADYLRRTTNHVLYRVTPMYENNDLLARGVLIEAFSVEDQGRGICLCIFCYNEQPGIFIDHTTGDNAPIAQ